MAIRSLCALLLLAAFISLPAANAAYDAKAGLTAIKKALKAKNYVSYVTLLDSSKFSDTLVTLLPKYKVTLLVGNGKAFGKLKNWAAIKKNANNMGFQIAAFNMLAEIQTKKAMLAYPVGKKFGTGDYNFVQTKLQGKNGFVLGSSASNASIVDWTVYMDAQIIIHGVDTVIMPPKFK